MPQEVKKISLFFLFFFFFTLSLQASFSLGIFGGTSAQKPGREGLEFNSDTRWVYGVRAGFKLLFLGVEGQYFQVAHHLQVKNIPHSWQDRQVDFSYLGAALKAYFSLLILHPYLSVGYGYYSAEVQGVDKDRKTGLNFGAGLELSLGERLSLQAEARYHRPSFDIEKADFSLGDFVLTAGLNINF
jgi:opacity protein-like surface antigen